MRPSPDTKKKKSNVLAGPHFQKGQSMVEFLVILPVMLGLVFGTIQIALIYQAKTTLNYAVFEAVKAGSLEYGDYNAIKEGFIRGMAPLYAYTEGQDFVGAVQQARNRISNEVEQKLVCIERITPATSTFADFEVSDESYPNGKVIPNDNLLYRSGTPGKQSDVSIQEANLLHIRISYCYPLIIPYVDKIIKSLLSEQGSKPMTFVQQCIDSKGIPIHAQSALRMQTPIKNTPGFNTAEYCRNITL